MGLSLLLEPRRPAGRQPSAASVAGVQPAKQLGQASASALWCWLSWPSVPRGIKSFSLGKDFLGIDKMCCLSCAYRVTCRARGAAMRMRMQMRMPMLHLPVSHLRSWNVIKAALRQGGGGYGGVCCALLNVLCSAFIRSFPLSFLSCQFFSLPFTKYKVPNSNQRIRNTRWKYLLRCKLLTLAIRKPSYAF